MFFIFPSKSVTLAQFYFMKDVLKEKKSETFTVLKNYEVKRRKKTLSNISVVLIHDNNGFKL